MGERGLFSFDDHFSLPGRTSWGTAQKNAQTAPLGRRRDRSSNRTEFRRIQETYHWTSGLQDSANRQQGSHTDRLCLTPNGERGPVRVVSEGAAGGRSTGGQLHGTGSLEGLQVLFEEDLAQFTPAVTRSKTGAARGRATGQPAQGPTPPPTKPAPSIPLPPPTPQTTEGAPPQSKSRPQLRKQATSAEHPGPSPP